MLDIYQLFNIIEQKSILFNRYSHLKCLFLHLEIFPKQLNIYYYMKQLEFFVELNGKYVKSYKNSLQNAIEYAFKLLANPDNSVCVWDNYANMYYPENYR